MNKLRCHPPFRQERDHAPLLGSEQIEALFQAIERGPRLDTQITGVDHRPGRQGGSNRLKECLVVDRLEKLLEDFQRLTDGCSL
jgi:hypothetical protein